VVGDGVDGLASYDILTDGRFLEQEDEESHCVVDFIGMSFLSGVNWGGLTYEEGGAEVSMGVGSAAAAFSWMES